MNRKDNSIDSIFLNTKNSGVGARIFPDLSAKHRRLRILNIYFEKLLQNTYNSDILFPNFVNSSSASLFQYISFKDCFFLFFRIILQVFFPKFPSGFLLG